MDSSHDLDQSIASRVAGLESDVRNIARNVSSLQDMMTTMAQKINTESKTNWGTLAAWGTVVLTIMSMLGYLALTPMARSLEDLSQKVYDHMNEYSHIGAGVRMDYIEKFLIESNKKHESQWASIKTLERDSHVNSERIKSLSDIIKDIRVEQRKRTSKVYGQ